jgi:hypothetical protein
MAGAFDMDMTGATNPVAPDAPTTTTDTTATADPNAFVRNKAYEALLIKQNPGFTQEYFDSRGGVNLEGYYGDVPSYARLSAAEYKTVTNKDGTVNTAAQAKLYQQKAYDYYTSQGIDPSQAASKASSGFGKYAITFKDKEGNVIEPSDSGSANSFGTTGQTEKTFAGFDANNQPLFSFGTDGAAMTSQQYSDRTDIMDTMRAKFKDYGLESLIPTIEKLAMEGATESTIFLALRESDTYKQRFSANEDRKKAGLAVLDPKTYLAVEDGYRQTLRSYGLTQFDNDNYVKQFIANDVSPTELSNRVATAVQRVQMASPEVMNTLTSYYGIPQSDIIGYILDPKQQFVNIERKVTASEIGASAARQGLQSNATTSEALAAQGITKSQAEQGYAQIADILPTAQKLSDIYGGQAQRYDQTAAEQETFGNLASAQRKRQQLTGLEIGSFSGQSGTSKGAFSTGYLNRQSSAGQF